MVVGTCILELQLPDVHSLKQKRSVIKSLTKRLHKQFNIACAEVDLHDAWQSASIGLAVVTTSAVHAQDVIDNVIHWVERHRPDVMIVGETIDMIY
jgi:hypothetical protein